jgi:mannose-1-phosphate guanylyltransferase
MSGHNDHVWGIILAGGEGKRLKQFVRSRFNSDCPKQFCVFTGTRSMLSHTIARALQFIPPEHLIVTINSDHRAYAERDIGMLDKRNIVVQPSNRETSASILFPLLHVVRRDPEARVIILPSDHFILEEQLFMKHVAAGDAFVKRHSKYLLLLGVELDHPEADYGWIETSMKIAEIDGCEIFRVKRFLEKPDAKKASVLQKNHSLCNTMVLAGLASTVIRKFRLTTPAVFQAFKRIDAELLSPREGQVVEEVYADLPSVDFSNAILQHDPRGLAVLRVHDVYWNDWGNAGRIEADLARLESKRMG